MTDITELAIHQRRYDEEILLQFFRSVKNKSRRGILLTWAEVFADIDRLERQQ